MIEIPLNPSQPADFEVDISGVRYRFKLYFNVRAALWHCDLSQNNTPLLTGVPFVLGTRLFRGYEIEGVPEDLILSPIDGSYDEANFDQLGARVRLLQLEQSDSLYDTTI